MSIAKTVAVQFCISSCSYDLNAIENVFIEWKDNSVFQRRVLVILLKGLKIFLNYPLGPIDNIINSMPNGIADLTRNKDERSRY